MTSSEPSVRRVWSQRLVLAVPVVAILGAGWAHRWMTEDGFIYLRVVRQIEAGNGPVFNAGERVEAYTGTLWVAVLTVADLVAPFRLEWISVVLGLLLTAAGVALAIRGSARLWGSPARGWLMPAGALLFVAVAPVWSYATSGLENGLAFAWIGASTLVLAGWAEPADADGDGDGDDGAAMRPRHAALLGLGWLVRPELVLLSAAFLLAVAWADRRRQSWRQRFALAAAAMALPLAYQFFRMGYFGALAPNTGTAKEGSDLVVARGWRYLRDFTDPYLLVVPVVALLAAGHLPLVRDGLRSGHRRRVAVVAALTAGSLANVAFVVAVGGDYHHGRLLLPALLALVAPAAVVPVARRHLTAAVVGIWAVLAAATLRPEQHGDDPFANGVLAPRGAGPVTLEQLEGASTDILRARAEAGAAFYEAGIGQYPELPFPLAPGIEPPLAALWGIGASGYAVGVDTDVLDLLGLADTFTAHLERPHPSDALVPGPGHEKPLPSAWLVARLADPEVVVDDNPFVPLGIPLIPETTGDEFVEQVAWARAALACPGIADILAAAREPLTAGRFVDNLVGAASNTRLRIPPDPEEAYRRFCGDEVPPAVAELRGRRGPTG